MARLFHLNIEEFYAFKTPDLKIIKSMIAEVGLDESLLSHQFNELSTGQNHLFMFNGDTPAIFDFFKKSEYFQPIGSTDAKWAFCILFERLMAEI